MIRVEVMMAWIMEPSYPILQVIWPTRWAIDQGMILLDGNDRAGQPALLF
ncbi:hypothetical protein [Chitinivorax tropicus]|nr:hypothetical protein [Chitinivorax tropicus]